jgi:hypothetical protein
LRAESGSVRCPARSHRSRNTPAPAVGRPSRATGPDSDSAAEVLSPILFNFPNAGRLLTLLFVLFAAWYVGVALVVAILATTLAFGRHWCSHLCPVASPLELGSRLVPTSLKLDFSRTPALPFRYAYLSVYFIAPAVGIGSLCCSYCNFAPVPRLFALRLRGRRRRGGVGHGRTVRW